MKEISMRRIVLTVLLLLIAVAPSRVQADPAPQPVTEVLPYLQHPTDGGVTVMWVTSRAEPDVIAVEGVGRFESSVTQADALRYTDWEIKQFLNGQDPGSPNLHRVVIKGLDAGKRYSYTRQSDGYRATLAGLPKRDADVRFVVYGDSETEPESTGKATVWPKPGDPSEAGQKRVYVVDQTEGYRANLAVIASREPAFIGIAGDIVETGGEQRDWDEFWRHNAGDLGQIASNVPIFAAVGNHENHHGPGLPGFYATAGSALATAKMRAYFDNPDNGSARAEHAGRYFSYEVGAIKYISLDVTNGSPHRSDRDTNWYLVGDGETDAAGLAGEVPDFNPGSPQHAWLERELADGKARFAFTFVQFHHVPYSVGPHGLPPGEAATQDTQSGVPVRVLTPLFKQYGVTAVFAAHDEMYEHSVVDGMHFYDAGIGGDGLRGPVTGPDGSANLPTTNEHQRFLAHADAPEVWDGKRLASGGKHYGHIEVDVTQTDGKWTARITPVYVFPLMNADGAVIGWERRTYDDEVTLQGRDMQP
jgi:hypothetical protein